MHQRLTRRRRATAAPPGGNLWLRSDLRQPPASRAPSRLGKTRPVVRSWLTWTLFGALLVTTAAAGHGYLVTEPKAPITAAMPAAPSLPSTTAMASMPSITSRPTMIDGADVEDVASKADTRISSSSTEPAPYAPEAASTLPALYALEDTQQQLMAQVEAIQASNRAMLDRLEHLQAALAPAALAATTPATTH